MLRLVGKIKDEMTVLEMMAALKLGGRFGKQLRSITFINGQASKEQMTWEVTGVTLSGNWYCIGLGKRLT